MSTNDTKISDFTNVLKQFYALIKDTLLSGYITEDELSQKGYLTGDSEAVREKAKQTELDTHTNNSTIHVTAAERTKWNGAAANVQSDWNVADPTSDAYVKNKPTIPTKTSQLMNDSYFAYNSVVGVSTEYGATNIGYSYYDADSKSSGGEVGLPNLRQALQEASETIAENMAKIDESIPEAPSAMTGATADADGTSGLVPAPLKGDQNKFLRADGTWVAPPESTLEETDPTVPDWAKQPTKPVYTAAEVGAEPEGLVEKITGLIVNPDGKVRISVELYRASNKKIVELDEDELCGAIKMATHYIALEMSKVHKAVPTRTKYTVGNSTAADSVLITDNGIITLRVYKISNDQLMAVNQYVYVSDTYGDSNTFVGKLAANTGALSNTYGTIAVSTADEAVKVASVKGYRIEITVMDCV